MNYLQSQGRWLVGGTLAAAVLLLAPGAAQARFAKADLVKIPIPKLVENLEKMAQKQPKDADLLFNLARVHAMAYALKTDTAEVWKNKEAEGAWYGYTPKVVPFEIKKEMDPQKLMEAQAHLQKALQRYKEAIKLDKNHLAAKLGHAWLIQQSGNKMQALKEYRDLIEEAWASESKLQFGHLGGNYITAEAAGYLIPLLDKEQNKDEIAKLKERIAKLEKLPKPVTPIAIPLAEGLSLADLLDTKARVKFDADGSGLGKTWTWISPRAGWLVYDPKGSKQITSGLQLFGNVTFWLHWDNGYRAMQALDDNADGFLAGPELAGLALWQDGNGNGVSEANEVKTLAAWGIVKLSCQYEASTDPNCAALSPAGVTFADGTVRPTYDVILHQVPGKGKQ